MNLEALVLLLFKLLTMYKQSLTDMNLSSHGVNSETYQILRMEGLHSEHQVIIITEHLPIRILDVWNGTRFIQNLRQKTHLQYMYHNYVLTKLCSAQYFRET